MNKPVEKLLARAVDGIQLKLTGFAQKLSYEDLPAKTVHTAKVRVIDTLGSLIGGFFAVSHVTWQQRCPMTMAPPLLARA